MTPERWVHLQKAASRLGVDPTLVWFALGSEWAAGTELGILSRRSINSRAPTAFLRYARPVGGQGE